MVSLHETQPDLRHPRAPEREGLQLLNGGEVGSQARCDSLHGVGGSDHQCVPANELGRAVTQTKLLRIAAEDHDRHGVVKRLVDLPRICPVGRDQEYPGLQ